MSPGVAIVRADICRDCPTPCARRLDTEAHRDPCAACGIGRWGKHDCGSMAPAPRLRGLGDAVAIVADPIARVLRLDPAKCGCAKRREKLNRLVPFPRRDSAP